MATYAAGDLTKIKLLETSKKVFYEKGFHDATMKEVCEIAGIKQSVFYYHYKDKNEMAARIYTDFGERHMGVILDLLRKDYPDVDITMNNCISMALFFLNSFDDMNLTRFWAQMYIDNQPLQLEWYRHRYTQMYKKSKLPNSPGDFDLFLISCTSVNGPLMAGYYNKVIDAPPEKIVRFKVEHTLRQLRYNEKEIHKKTDQIMEIAKSLPVTAGENFDIFVNGIKSDSYLKDKIR